MTEEKAIVNNLNNERVATLYEEKPLSEKESLGTDCLRIFYKSDVAHAVARMKKLNTITEKDWLEIFGDLK